MKQFLTLLLFLVGLGASPAAAQQGYVTVSGYIEDATSHEALIGASVYAPALGQGTMSNSQGFYSLRLPIGTHELSARYLGYAPYSWASCRHPYTSSRKSPACWVRPT